MDEAMPVSPAFLSNSVWVIVVTYNSSGCILACLQSLRAASSQFELRVTVVDNASTDDTIALVEAFGADIEILRQKDNTGYAGGNNTALQRHPDHERHAGILFLNPDAQLLPGSIDALMALLYSANEIGGVSPSLVEHAGATKAALNTLWGLPMNRRYAGLGEAIISDRLHGCCMLVKPQLLAAAGLFEPSYFLYWEELDLCARARKAGLKLLLHEGVPVLHRVGEAERAHRIYYMWRNQFHFARRNLGRLGAALFLSRRLALSSPSELLHFVVRRRGDLVRAALAGLVAGLCGEHGHSASPHAQPTPSRLPASQQPKRSSAP